MLPKESPLARKQLTHLRIYTGAEHPHEAQNPEVIDFKAANPKNVAEPVEPWPRPTASRPCRASATPARRAPRRARAASVDAQGRAYATGKRKNAIARVWIKPGKGKITINGRDQEVYFARPVLRMMIAQPLQVTDRARPVRRRSSP